MRNELNEIFREWYKIYGFDLKNNTEYFKEIIDKILAIKVKLPDKKKYPEYEGTGWNACINEVRKLNGMEEE